MTKESCPNCGASIKSSLLGTNALFDDQKVKIINMFTDNAAEAYCNKCGKKPYHEAGESLIHERENLASELRSLISEIPVITAHNPHQWDYSVLGMVTGQSTTGTGVITEFTSSFTDIFGAQSKRHNSKLKRGEDLCFAQLRTQAYDLGGNAVIAADIDYSEIGAGKGMLMVCMAGTAIRLNNPEVLGSERKSRIERIPEVQERLEYLKSLKVDHQYS